MGARYGAMEALVSYGIDQLIGDVRWIVKAFGRPDAKAGIPR